MGSEVNRHTYLALFTVIGTTFGIGDGVNTFKLPDYRGAFLRGAGTPLVNNQYVGPALNNTQLHATQTHNHGATSNVTDPGHDHIQRAYNDNYDHSGATGQLNPAWAKADSTLEQTYANINSRITGVTVTTTVDNSTLSVNPNETRPYNFGINWIIKY